MNHILSVCASELQWFPIDWLQANRGPLSQASMSSGGGSSAATGIFPPIGELMNWKRIRYIDRASLTQSATIFAIRNKLLGQATLLVVYTITLCMVSITFFIRLWRIHCRWKAWSNALNKELTICFLFFFFGNDVLSSTTLVQVTNKARVIIIIITRRRLIIAPNPTV